MRILSFVFSVFAVCSVMVLSTSAQAQNYDYGFLEGARLTAGFPAYVYHPHELPGPEDWNEGWGQNEGVLFDLSWPVYPLGEKSNLRAGFTTGGFDNSLHDFSFFLGGIAELEGFITDNVALNLGTYAGLITGYDQSPAPAMAPYAGTTYLLSDRAEVGLRGFWLPAETALGRDLAPSDAYVGAVTIGTRF